MYLIFLFIKIREKPPYCNSVVLFRIMILINWLNKLVYVRYVNSKPLVGQKHEGGPPKLILKINYWQFWWKKVKCCFQYWFKQENLRGSHDTHWWFTCCCCTRSSGGVFELRTVKFVPYVCTLRLAFFFSIYWRGCQIETKASEQLLTFYRGHNLKCYVIGPMFQVYRRVGNV